MIQPHLLPLNLRSTAISAHPLTQVVLTTLRCSLLTANCILILLLAPHCSLSTAFAQSASANLSGSVVDQNGAVVPGANVKVSNTATGLQREVTTNDQGSFTVPLLPPTTYTVRVERQGFAPVEATVVLNVGDQKSLTISLNAGDISAMVQVATDAPLINESPAVGTVVDRQFVENMPLNGRSFQSLITLSPGVVLTKATIGQQGQFSVNGQRSDANYFTVDGVSANVGVGAVNIPGQSGAGTLPALSASGGTNNLVSVDALQEFRIQTSTYAPEFGRMPGAQVSIVTRSGTNDFHGSLFDYFRNDVLDSSDWFANANRTGKPPLRQNDFGGVLGGPIIKNRTFFFFSYEGLRLRQPVVGISSVPSLAARQDAPVAVRPLINLYPLPNGPEIGNGLASFSASFSNPSSLDATSIRIDHVANNKLTFFGRYNYAPSETSGRASSITTLNTITFLDVNTQTLTLGATYTFMPKLINELRVNHSRNRSESFAVLDDFGGAVVAADSALLPSGRSSQDSLTSFQLSGTQAGLIRFGQAPNHLQQQLNLVNNLSWSLSTHQLKLGFDYRHLSPVFQVANYLQTLTFSGIGSGSSPAAGTVLSGKLATASITAQTSPQEVIFRNFSAYAQDTWKATPQLTLTYGIRWDVNPPPASANGNPPFTLTQVIDPSAFAFAARGTPLWQTTYGNLSPRIGASYLLSDKSSQEIVLRGGFGLFYDLGQGQAANAFLGTFPFTSSRSLTNVTFPLSTTDATPPAAGTFTSSSVFFAFDHHLQLPKVYQWNFTVERSLGQAQALSAGYVAAVGRGLLRLESFNNANTSFPGTVQVSKNNATSDYHAMQLQFRRRLSRGLQALASYTWSKSLDTVSDDSIVTTRGDKIDPRQDRAPSDFDVRHAFNAAATYQLPMRGTGSIAKAVLRNWAVDSIFTARSATPVSVVYSRNLGFGNVSLRPDIISGIPVYLTDATAPGGRRFNNSVPTAAQLAAAGCTPVSPTAPAKGPFCTPVAARQGTLGRNALRGFNVWQLDLAVRRQVNLTERINLQFRAESFNIFNHPNFADPIGTLTSTSFGVSTTMLGRSLGSGGLTGGFNPLYQIGGPRSIQVSMKLGF